jgi:brefeldin A-inhibited guanine nucleotide-exchange protein
MNRIKIIWSRMWEIMREHFLELGCNKNVDLAIYAID